MMVGERLRAIRELKGMSQGDIERKTGLFRCYVSRVENGHTVPAIETLEKWARALNVHISQLFLIDGAGVPRDILKNVPKRRRAAMSTDAQRSLQGISRYIDRIEPKKRTLLVMLARKMAD